MDNTINSVPKNSSDRFKASDEDIIRYGYTLEQWAKIPHDIQCMIIMDNDSYDYYHSSSTRYTPEEIKKKTISRYYLEMIEIDRNLFALPFFHYGAVLILATYTEWKHKEEKCSIACESLSGVPSAFDHRVFNAILRLWTKYVNRLLGYVEFTYSELAREMGVDPRSYLVKIANSLDVLVKATYTIKNGFYNCGIAGYEKLTEEFHLLTDLTYIESDDKRETRVRVKLPDVVIKNIQDGYFQRTDHAVFKELKRNEIASRLYEYLQIKRNMHVETPLNLTFNTLASRIPLDDTNTSRRNKRILKALNYLKIQKQIKEISVNDKGKSVSILFEKRKEVDPKLFSDYKEPAKIDDSNTINVEHTTVNNDDVKANEQNNGFNDDKLTTLYKNINKNIGELTEYKFKKLIADYTIDKVEDWYKNYIVRKEKQIVDKNPIGWFIASIQKGDFTYHDDYKEKKKIDEKRKQDRVEDEKRIKFNKLYENDPDCVGANDARIVVNIRTKLLSLFTSEELKQLIDIKLKTPMKIDGNGVVYKYRYEAIQALYDYIHNDESETNRIINKLKNILNGNEEAVPESVFSFDINKARQEEEARKQEQERILKEEKLKQLQFKEQNYDEELKDINESEYQKYYEYKQALLNVLDKDEYLKVINFKKELLAKLKLKPLNKMIIEDIYKNVFDSKQVKLKKTIETLLDRTIETESLQYDRTVTQEIKYEQSIVTEKETVAVKEEAKKPTIDELQEKINNVTPPKSEPKKHEPKIKNEVVDQTLNVMLTGEQLKEAREKAGISIRELENLIGYDNSTISKWEKGHRSIPKKLIPKIKEVLGI